MPKAQIIDRVALTKQKMKAGERIKANAQTVLPEKYTKETSPFLKMRAEMKGESPELQGNAQKCPTCGAQMKRWESCLRCEKCGTSLC